jgi:hypothetical protein
MNKWMNTQGFTGKIGSHTHLFPSSHSSVLTCFLIYKQLPGRDAFRSSSPALLPCSSFKGSPGITLSPFPSSVLFSTGNLNLYWKHIQSYLSPTCYNLLQASLLLSLDLAYGGPAHAGLSLVLCSHLLGSSPSHILFQLLFLLSLLFQGTRLLFLLTPPSPRALW